jgi:hypothetical protein
MSYYRQQLDGSAPRMAEIQNAVQTRRSASVNGVGGMAPTKPELSFMHKTTVLIIAVWFLAVTTAHAGLSDMLDQTGRVPWPSTREAIENTVYGKLSYAMVTYGPIEDNPGDFLCKIAFRIDGDSKLHCAVIHERVGFGPSRILSCQIDF